MAVPLLDKRSSRDITATDSSPSRLAHQIFELSMESRWKGKGSKAKALEQPMSKTISDLQSSLIESKSNGILSGSSVLLEANQNQTHLLNLACFGRSIPTSQNNNQWFQVGLEEAFFLFHSLKCLQILINGCQKSEQEIWTHMCLKTRSFPQIYRAYSHLRMKNWVVRPGSQYGVDYVAYRHHPAFVHSEFAVLVVSDDGTGNQRLSAWSDFHCTLRLCGSVAKTLLVIEIRRKMCDVNFSVCLEELSVTERTITRWNPKRNREEKTNAKRDDHHTLIQS